MSSASKLALLSAAGMSAMMRNDMIGAPDFPGGPAKSNATPGPFPLVRDAETGEPVAIREERGEEEPAPAAGPVNPAAPVMTREEPPPGPEPIDRGAIARAERKRIADITQAGQRLAIPDEEIQAQIDGDATLDGARSAFAAYLEEHREAPRPTAGVSVPANGQDEITTLRGHFADAICLRSGLPVVDDHGQPAEIAQPARHMSGFSALGMLAELIEQRGDAGRGVQVRGLPPQQLLEIATRSQAGGDFTHILANLATKMLMRGYTEAPKSYERFVNEITLSDFKGAKLASASSFPDLLQNEPGEELKLGAFGDAGETIALATFGRIVSIDRQTLINDDLGAILRMINSYGAAVNRLEAALVYKILNSNPEMADGKALFSTEHGNIAASGAAPSETTIAAGYVAMKAQRGVARPNETAEQLDLEPSTLLVSPANYVPAVKYTASTTPASAADKQVFDSLTAVSTGRIDGKKWFLLADKSQADVIQLARLAGSNGPMVMFKEGFNVLGMDMVVAHDAQAKAVDWRGAFYNPGE